MNDSPTPRPDLLRTDGRLCSRREILRRSSAGFGALALSGLLGALIERWLFFAEATHTVMLYYREQQD